MIVSVPTQYNACEINFEFEFLTNWQSERMRIGVPKVAKAFL